MNTRLMLLLFALVACSCGKQVTIDIPDEGYKPVLNVLMANDSLVTAQVLLSKYITAGPADTVSVGWKPLDNARLKLFVNDEFREELVMRKREDLAYYVSSVKVNSGDKYRVTADVPGFPQVSGEDSVPFRVLVGGLRVKKISDGQSNSKANVSLIIRDEPGIRNFYRIRIYEHLSWNDGGNDKSLLQLSIQATDPSDVMFGKKERQEVFIDDQLFDGRPARFNFVATSWAQFQRPVEIEVTTLTYASYNYLYSSMMAVEKNDNILSEKVIVYNNIVNGLGIVGAMAINRYTVVY